MKANEGMFIELGYTYQTVDGIELGSSATQGPLCFVMGTGSVLPSIEEHIYGKVVGEQCSFKIIADDAYGQRNEDLVYILPYADIRAHTGELQIGQQVSSTIQGENMLFWVKDIIDVDDTIIFDANHPLAGMDLVFSVELLQVTESIGTDNCGCSGGAESHGNKSGACGCSGGAESHSNKSGACGCSGGAESHGNKSGACGCSGGAESHDNKSGACGCSGGAESHDNKSGACGCSGGAESHDNKSGACGCSGDAESHDNKSDACGCSRTEVS